MSSLLLFDDTWLLACDGLKRKIGKPVRIASYSDPDAIICMGAPSVIEDRKNERYLLYYTGFPHGATRETLPTPLIAVSENGIDFRPMNTEEILEIPDRKFHHQLMDSSLVQELATVLRDPIGTIEESYKALTCRREDDRFFNEIWVSPDGIQWSKKNGTLWHREGAEPGAAVYWNENEQRYILTVRPYWGDRRIAVCHTMDFFHFSVPELMMQADSLDEPLTEIYGMPCVPYDGYVIGFPWMFHPNREEQGTKFWKGIMNTQLAYSENGKYFQRSLRDPLFANGDPGEPDCGVVLASSMLREKNGDLRFYAFTRSLEHGPWRRENVSTISIYRLRRDGFVFLETTGGEAVLRTRDMLWKGGMMTINLNCTGGATCAVLDHDMNPIENFSHDDCQPFAGNDTSWSPMFKDSMDHLRGKIVRIEIRLLTGRIYSIRGDFMLLSAQKARYFLKHGILEAADI